MYSCSVRTNVGQESKPALAQEESARRDSRGQ